MEVHQTTSNGRTALHLRGKFDFSAQQTFREAMNHALHTAGDNEIGVDLRDVSYIDSSALGMLLMMRDTARAAGKAIVLTNSSHAAVRQAIDAAHFAKLFQID
jgi:anti-anti-sigma factor